MSLMTIGALAKEVGVHVETIRYYERVRLLKPSSRTASGYRQYGEAEVGQLRFIKEGKALGFTLQEMREFLNLNMDSPVTSVMAKRRAQVKLKQVNAQIQQLRSLAVALRRLVRSCTADPAAHACPILEAFRRGAAPKQLPRRRVQ